MLGYLIILQQSTIREVSQAESNCAPVRCRRQRSLQAAEFSRGFISDDVGGTCGREPQGGKSGNVQAGKEGAGNEKARSNILPQLVYGRIFVRFIGHGKCKLVWISQLVLIELHSREYWTDPFPKRSQRTMRYFKSTSEINVKLRELPLFQKPMQQSGT